MCPSAHSTGLECAGQTAPTLNNRGVSQEQDVRFQKAQERRKGLEEKVEDDAKNLEEKTNPKAFYLNIWKATEG